MPIYTKKGDKGLSSVLNGERIPKNSLVFEVLGTIDEANSFLGLAESSIKEQYLRNKLTQVQRTLFNLSSIIAGAKGAIPKSIVKKYEKEIDAWTKAMPTLKNFVFPGGSKAAAFLFTARTIVRRAERLMVKLNEESKLPANLLIYINRLSDYLFVLARYINFREKVKEEAWRR